MLVLLEGEAGGSALGEELGEGDKIDVIFQSPNPKIFASSTNQEDFSLTYPVLIGKGGRPC